VNKFPHFLAPISRWYWKRLVPFSAARSTIILTVSESSKRDIIELLGVSPNRIKVIPLAPAEIYRPLKDVHFRKTLYEKYKIPGPYIFSLATIEPRKNFMTLVKSFKILKELVKRSHFLVISGSKAWNFPELFQLVKRLELEREVLFTGYVPEEDKVILYNGCEFFVYPSLYEGFGLTPLEAMACGKAVIASKISSLPEIIGEAGILVDPTNEFAFAHAIKLLLDNPKLRQEYEEKSLERAKNFSWKSTAQKTLEFYGKVYRSEKL